MQRKRWFIILLLAVLPLLAGAGLAVYAQSGQEMPLVETGMAYEINADSQGKLWISDYLAQQVREINPADGSYTDYNLEPDGPSDARSDGAGNLWWADLDAGQVGRLSTASGEGKRWQVPGSTGLYGTALDGGGGLWATDYVWPYLYHLDVEGSSVCTYTLPLDGMSDYLLVDGGEVWLADWFKEAILRLDTTNDTFRRWPLAEGSRPTGILLDEAGDLWWADNYLGELARLTPGTNQVVTYKQAAVKSPAMLALDGGRIWFTNENNFGVLDPSCNAGQAVTVTPEDVPKPPNCGSLAQPNPFQAARTSGQAAWTSRDYARVTNTDGWSVFQLPETGYAWGITVLEGEAWLVDQGRQVLARIPTKTDQLIFLPFVIR